jgi:hypothetical protein
MLVNYLNVGEFARVKNVDPCALICCTPLVPRSFAIWGFSCDLLRATRTPVKFLILSQQEHFPCRKTPQKLGVK